MNNPITTGVGVGLLIVAIFAALGWVLALTVAPDAINMALGATFWVLIFGPLYGWMKYMDKR